MAYHSCCGQDGACHWNELLESPACGLRLPADGEQIPDIFIYLVNRGKPICFLKLDTFKTEIEVGSSVSVFKPKEGDAPGAEGYWGHKAWATELGPQG